MEICIYTLACVYMCVRASCSVPGHTIMTLLQELRVSRGNPASEGSLGALFADFSTLALESHASYAFRKETRETEIRGRRGGSISLGSRMDRLEPVILYS